MAAPAITEVLAEFSSLMLMRGLNALYVAAVFAVAFLVGLLVAKLVNGMIKGIFSRGKLEEKIRAKGLQNALLGFTLTQIITVLVKIYIVLIFFGAAAQIVNIGFLTSVVQMLLSYLASFSQGAAIIIAALLIAAYLGNTIKKQGKLLFARQLALGLKVFLGYIALVLSLRLILPNIGSKEIELLMSLFTLLMQAVILAFGLAVGLSLGLGLKEPISKAAQKNQQLFDDFFAKMGKE